MIHDILLSLMGHTGAVIERTGSSFVLSEEAQKLCKKMEIDLINRCVHIGFTYLKLTQFIEHVEELLASSTTCLTIPFPRRPHTRSTTTTPFIPRSLYIHAIVESLEETLDQYRDHIVDVERQYVELSHELPLSHLLLSLQSWAKILPTLNQLMDRMMSERLHGGALMTFIHNAAAARSDEVKPHLDAMLTHMSHTFLRQLTSWIVYNQVDDPYHEFFVQRWRIDDGTRGEMGLSKEAVVFNHSEYVDALGYERVRPFQQRTPQSYRFQWNSLYKLHPELVPMHVMTLTCAQKVLFIGRALRELRMADSMGTTHGGTNGSTDYISRTKVQVPAIVDAEIETLRNLWNAPCADMPLTWVLERSVETIRRVVANELKHVVVTDADLRTHIVFLKGFFLLGFGHFWRSFIDESDVLMREPPSPYAENELMHGPWSLAMQQFMVENKSEDYAKRFDIRLIPEGFDFEGFLKNSSRLTLIGFARIEGKYLSLGRTTSGAPAMVWSHSRQNIVDILRHEVQFQLMCPKKKPGEGARLTIIFQHQRNPVALSRDSSFTGGKSLGWPSVLEEAFGVEVSIRRSRNAAPGEPHKTDIKLEMFMRTTHVGTCWKLAAAEKSVVSEYSLDEDTFVLALTAHNGLYTASIGGDLLVVEKQLDLSEYLSMELECAYVGLANVPLNHDHALWNVKGYPLPVDKALKERPNNILGTVYGSGKQPKMQFSSEDLPIRILSWTHLSGGDLDADMDVSPRDRGPSRSPEEGSGTLGAGMTTTTTTTQCLPSMPYANKKIDPWINLLTLCMNVPWPTSLIVTDEALLKYNQLFRLLFAFRRTQVALQKAWCLKRTKSSGTPNPTGVSDAETPYTATTSILTKPPEWTIWRSHMLFFVSQILQYFQQDVVDGYHFELLRLVDKSDDFEDLRPAHDEFLYNVMRDCFVFVPELLEALMDSVHMAHHFATAVFWYGENERKGKEKKEECLRTMRQTHIDFQGKMKLIFQLLSGLGRDSPSLERLLLRIDFNDFFTS